MKNKNINNNIKILKILELIFCCNIFKWWGNLGHHNEECTTTEIEIVNKSEDNEDDQTVVIESMNATLERDNMYCIYSSETPDEITQQSQRACGYVVL